MSTTEDVPPDENQDLGPKTGQAINPWIQTASPEARAEVAKLLHPPTYQNIYARVETFLALEEPDAEKRDQFLHSLRLFNDVPSGLKALEAAAVELAKRLPTHRVGRKAFIKLVSTADEEYSTDTSQAGAIVVKVPASRFCPLEQSS